MGGEERRDEGRLGRRGEMREEGELREKRQDDDPGARGADLPGG